MKKTDAQLNNALTDFGRKTAGLIGLNEQYLSDLLVFVSNQNDKKCTRNNLEKDINEAISKLNDSSIPDGDLYIIAPKDVFRYKKSGTYFLSMVMRTDGFSQGSLDEAIKYLREVIDYYKPKGIPVSLEIIFFDEASKKNFEQMTRGFGFKRSDTPVLSKGDGIRLYNYRI